MVTMSDMQYHIDNLVPAEDPECNECGEYLEEDTSGGGYYCPECNISFGGV